MVLHLGYVWNVGIRFGVHRSLSARIFPLEVYCQSHLWPGRYWTHSSHSLHNSYCSCRYFWHCCAYHIWLRGSNIPIADRQAQIVSVRASEFNMDEALEYCFSFIRNTAETWLKYENKPEKRQRFQKLIFEGNLPFTGERFGTAPLTCIYDLYQSYRHDPSQLVTLTGNNWNRLLLQVKAFQVMKYPADK